MFGDKGIKEDNFLSILYSIFWLSNKEKSKYFFFVFDVFGFWVFIIELLLFFFLWEDDENFIEFILLFLLLFVLLFMLMLLLFLFKMFLLLLLLDSVDMFSNLLFKLFIFFIFEESFEFELFDFLLLSFWC